MTPMDSREDTFDGETPCRVCGVIICAYCQGRDPDCPAKTKNHTAGCSYLKATGGGDD